MKTGHKLTPEKKAENLKKYEAIKKAHNELEVRVKERTLELDKRIAELKDARKAILNVFEDLNIEKTKAENLANDLKKFKLALDNVSDHVTITDKEGIVVYANQAVERITGYKPEEAVGKKAGVLWKLPMPKEYYQKLWETIKEKRNVFIGEIQNKRKNGEIYIAQITISPVLNAGGEIMFFVGLERDITQEKKIDKAKTEFVSLASHQLRTPLTAISWYTEMILNGDVGKVVPSQKKYLEEIYQGNQRMIKLVNTLLDVSRIELGTFKFELKPTDIVTLAKSVIDEQQINIKNKNLIFITNFSKNIPTFSTDPNLLRMVFQNLLNNSVTYTVPEGEIKFSISFDDKNTILIKVSDTGFGIPKNQQDKIFTKLFRADNAREKDTNGNGLGLYIVKSVVQSLNGKIWFESPTKDIFESNKGPGTTFYVTLPFINKI